MIRFFVIYIPGTQMTSIFEGQPLKTRPFSNQNKGHLGSRYIYIYVYILMIDSSWTYTFGIYTSPSSMNPVSLLCQHPPLKTKKTSLVSLFSSQGMDFWDQNHRIKMMGIKIMMQRNWISTAWCVEFSGIASSLDSYVKTIVYSWPPVGYTVSFGFPGGHFWASQINSFAEKPKFCDVRLGRLRHLLV